LKREKWWALSDSNPLRQCKYNAVSEPELPPETERARVARFSCRLCRTLAEEIGDTVADHAAHHRSLRRS
jgi:hypothetical protein